MGMIDYFKNIFSLGTINQFDYLLNDPSYSINKKVNLNINPNILKLTVLNKRNINLNYGTAEYQASYAYYSSVITINYIQNIISRFRKPIPRWASNRNLVIQPRAGKQINAFYNRTGLYFYWDVDPVSKRNIYTVDSCDIITHELGHAILDAIRPDFWSVQSLEIWSLHEAFSDIVAMVSLMLHDEVIQYALKETNNNLNKSNIISKIAEQVGQLIYKINPNSGYNQFALRDAVNDFVYKDPSLLPNDGPDNMIVAEEHSFARIFVGAWYDIFVKIFELESKSMDLISALKKARDVAFTYLIKACYIVPRNNKTFEAIAKIMIVIDSENSSKYKNILESVFEKRNIINLNNVRIFSNDIKIQNFNQIEKHENFYIARKSKAYKIKAGDYLIFPLSNNPVFQSKIEVANEELFIFNKDKILVQHLTSSFKDSILEANRCLSKISKNINFEENFENVWKIKDKNLIRNLIKF